MRYSHHSFLPLEAFSPMFGHMRLYGGGGNPVSAVSDTLSSIGDSISNAVSNTAQSIGDIGASIDSTVRKDVPGGWATVGAAALLAAGISSPTLLSSAEEGTLTAEELANAGVTAEQATTIADLSTPESAMANFQAGNVTAAEAYKAGVTASDLVNSGASISDVVSAGNEAAVDLFNGGTSLSNLTDAGVKVSDLISGGASPAELLKSGVSLSDLVKEGASASNLLTIGVSPTDLANAGEFSSTNPNATYNVSDLFGANSHQSISPLTTAQNLLNQGVDPKIISEGAREAGYLSSDITNILNNATTSTLTDIANSIKTAYQALPTTAQLANQIGTGLGLTVGNGATTVGNAVLGAGMNSLVAVATGGDVGKAALSGAIGAGVSANAGDIATSILGKENLQTLATATKLSTAQVAGLFTNAISTGIMTGVQGGDVLKAIKTNLASTAIGNYAGNVVNLIDPGKINAAVSVASGIAKVGTATALNGGDIGKAITSQLPQIIGNTAFNTALNQTKQLVLTPSGLLDTITVPTTPTTTPSGALPTTPNTSTDSTGTLSTTPTTTPTTPSGALDTVTPTKSDLTTPSPLLADITKPVTLPDSNSNLGTLASTNTTGTVSDVGNGVLSIVPTNITSGGGVIINPSGSSTTVDNGVKTNLTDSGNTGKTEQDTIDEYNQAIKNGYTPEQASTMTGYTPSSNATNTDLITTPTNVASSTTSTGSTTPTGALPTTPNTSTSSTVSTGALPTTTPTVDLSPINKQLTDLSTSQKTLTDQYNSLSQAQKNAVDALTKQGTDAATAIDAVTKDVANLGKSLDTTNTTLTDLSKTVDTNQSATEKALSTLTDEQKSLVKAQTDMGVSLGDAIATVQSGLNTTNKTVSDLGTSVTDLGKTVSTNTKSITDLGTQEASDQLATQKQLDSLTSEQKDLVKAQTDMGVSLSKAISNVQASITKQAQDTAKAQQAQQAQGALSSLATQSAPPVTNPSTIVGTSLAGQPSYGQGNTKILADLKQLYPQLSQVNPKLLSQLGLSQDLTPKEAPLSKAIETAQTNPILSTTSFSSDFGLPKLTLKSGGLAHIPEFITGHTGHYASGKGDGQSDDIKALLNDGDYVIDAEAVAQLGNGSSKAGKDVLERFRASVPHKQHHASGGKVPAMIADGEYVLPSGFVSALGHGDGDKGAKALDKMREALRQHKRSAPLNKIPPKSKSPLEYLRDGFKMKEKR